MGLVQFNKKRIQIWGFDTETVQGHPYLYQLTCDKQKYIYENKISDKHFRESFFKLVLDKCETDSVLFSYNLYFEILVLFRDRLEMFEKNRFRFQTKDYFIEGMIEAPTPRMILYGNNKRIYFIDAMRFFTGDRHLESLESIAKAFLEVPKMKRVSWIGKRKPRQHEKKKFFEYAILDAYLAEKCGEIIIDFYGLAKVIDITYSVSHLAGESFRKNFTNGEGLDLGGEEVENFADEARFGGYRACHILPGVYKDVLHLDLDSAYPYAMTLLPSFYHGKYLHTGKFNEFGIYRIKTILPENDRPYFQRKKWNSTGNSYKLEFIPQGIQVIFTVSGYEINVFKSVFPKWNYKILDGYVWKGQNKNKPLANWVNYWHNKKLNVSKDDKSKLAERQFYKLMLNTISGKADSVIFERDEYWITKEGVLEKGKVINGSMKNYFVAVLIRAIPRAITWKMGFYVDSLFEVTDSLCIYRKELSKVKIERGLGKWGFEVGEDRKADLVFEMLGRYFYFDSKQKLKTAVYNSELKKKVNEPLKQAIMGFHSSWKEYFKLLKKGGGFYKKMRMNKVREMIRQGTIEKTLTFEKKKYEKQFDEKFRKEVLKWVKS